MQFRTPQNLDERRGEKAMITFILPPSEAPRYAIRASSEGLRPDERPIGIQTRIDSTLIKHGGLSSPFLPDPKTAKPPAKALA